MSVDAKVNLIRFYLDGHHLNKCHSCLKDLEKTRRCSKCKVAFYCSTKCQSDHWHDKKIGHKHICDALIGARTKEGKSSKKKVKTEEEEDEEVQREALALVRNHEKERLRIRREQAVPDKEEEEDELSELEEEVVQALSKRRDLVKEAQAKRKAETDACALEEITFEEAQEMVRTRRRRVQEVKERAMVADPVGHIILEALKHTDVLLRFARAASFADVARWSRVSRDWNAAIAKNQRFWYFFIITRPENNQMGAWDTFTNYRNIAFSRFAIQGGWWAGWNFGSNRQMVKEIVRLVSTNESNIQDIIEMYNPAELMSLSITNRSFMTYFGQNPEFWQSLLYNQLQSYQGDDIDRIRRIAYTDGLPAQNYRATVLSSHSGYRVELSGNILPVWDSSNPFRRRWVEVCRPVHKFNLDITWLDIYHYETVENVIDTASPDHFMRIHWGRPNSVANYNLCEVYWYWDGDEGDSDVGEFPWPDRNYVENYTPEDDGRLVIVVEQKGWDATCIVTFPDELKPEYNSIIQSNPIEINIYEADNYDWIKELSDNWPQIWFNKAEMPVLNDEEWEVHVTVGTTKNLQSNLGFIVPGFEIFPQNLNMFRRMIDAQIDEIFDGNIDQELVYNLETDLLVNLEVRRK